jgi:hypothetical protein
LSAPLATASPIASSSIAQPGARPSFLTELLALLGLACFLPVNGAHIQGRESTITVLALLALIAWIVVDPLLHSRDLVFSWLAVPDVACVALGVLALAWVLTKVARPGPGYRRALVLTLGALPVAMIGEVASWKLTSTALMVLEAVLSLYALLYFWRGLRALTGRSQPGAVAAGAVMVALLLIAFDGLQTNPRFWVRGEEKLDRLNTAGADWARMARVQFAQQARIDAAIREMAPQVPGQVDTFFLGFAGYGHEPIFAREIGLAADVVGDRFRARDRSLRLVNDPKDSDTWPIATEPGLRHALRRLGEVMGDEDVLFLTFSSHGDRGRGVRVSSPGMVSMALSPESLAGMLRDAGIEWRVIVVSACYSGGFSEALADERSIVITAAAPDRKSFGCNDSRALTYFGEAFFQDALNANGSLRAAFGQARVALEQKEREQGIVPSMPQAKFGSQLEARLEGRIARAE